MRLLQSAAGGGAAFSLLLAAAQAQTPAAPPAPAPVQLPETSNTIGMKLVLLPAGKVQIGVFTPTCPVQGGAARGAPPAAATGAVGPGSIAAGATASPPGAPAAAAAGRGGAPAGGRGGGAPPDPRNSWSAEDYATCAKILAPQVSQGFTVDIPKPFYIGKYEVTQREWKAVMGNNPSAFQGAKVADDSDNHPVDSVTWTQAQAFVRALNAKEKTTAYRLPTEYEWEYACRAGGPGQNAWATIREQGLVQATRGANGLSAATASVGSRPANLWGLHDMLGNAWEWTADPYNGKLFGDPVPKSSGAIRVLKGGSFTSDVKNAICAQHGGGPGNGWDVSFRVVKDVP